MGILKYEGNVDWNISKFKYGFDWFYFCFVFLFFYGVFLG